MTVTLLTGDCLEMLRTLPAASVQTCVTSPPYFGLRDYGVAGQIGLEETPEAYVAKLVAVFREVKRVLKSDGTVWINIGDSYSSQGGPEPVQTRNPNRKGGSDSMNGGKPRKSSGNGIKPKDLIGIPWMVAFALRADGWWLRSDIIWHKPNPMPENVTDRPTKAHEYIFLLAKSQKYFYDAEAIKEPGVGTEYDKTRRPLNRMVGARYITEGKGQTVVGASLGNGSETRNKRDVWTVTTKSYKGAHFATFPPDLIEPCILAGSRPGDTVLDPFSGSGTTGAVSIKHGRSYIGIELNPEYIVLTKKRLAQVQPTLTMEAK